MSRIVSRAVPCLGGNVDHPVSPYGRSIAHRILNKRLDQHSILTVASSSHSPLRGGSTISEW